MAPGKITKVSSSGSIPASGNNENTRRNANPPTEAAHREGIIHLASQNLINPQFARLAWFQSIERDLHQIRLELQALERATFEESRCENGKKQLKRKGKGL